MLGTFLLLKNGEFHKVQGKTHRITNKFGLKFQGYEIFLLFE